MEHIQISSDQEHNATIRKAGMFIQCLFTATSISNRLGAFKNSPGLRICSVKSPIDIIVAVRHIITPYSVL